MVRFRAISSILMSCIVRKEKSTGLLLCVRVTDCGGRCETHIYFIDVIDANFLLKRLLFWYYAGCNGTWENHLRFDEGLVDVGIKIQSATGDQAFRPNWCNYRPGEKSQRLCTGVQTHSSRLCGSW